MDRHFVIRWPLCITWMKHDRKTPCCLKIRISVPRCARLSRSFVRAFSHCRIVLYQPIWVRKRAQSGRSIGYHVAFVVQRAYSPLRLASTVQGMKSPWQTAVQFHRFSMLEGELHTHNNLSITTKPFCIFQIPCQPGCVSQNCAARPDFSS